MFIYLDPEYCEDCPYTRGICGCSKYLTEEGNNINCGLNCEGKRIRLDICKKENPENLT